MTDKTHVNTMLVDSFDAKLINQTINLAWPKEYFHELKGPDKVKSFYNTCYDEFINQLNSVLDRYHPASWILIGYRQSEIWTAIYHKKMEGNVNFAPAARYGWRFVIEQSLEKLSYNYPSEVVEPTEEDIQKVFTAIVVGLQVSELSNYIHYLKGNFESVSLKFGPHMLSSPPTLDAKDLESFSAIRNYLWGEHDLKKYPRFSAASNETFLDNLNRVLEEDFGFNLAVILYIIKGIGAMASFYKASIIVQPYEDFIGLLCDITKLQRQVVESVVIFSFIYTKNPFHEKRQLLKKSQPVRLLNYAGIILEMDKSFSAIYAKEHVKREDIIKSKKHIIVSAALLAEWLDMLPHRIAFGFRSDLQKISEKINKDLALLELLFKRKIFESEIKELYERDGFSCVNIEKLNGKLIDCGEIDIVAYHPTKNNLIVVECKVHGPIIDARYLNQVVKDHFEQKNYHSKFLKKIEWVEQHKDIITEIFKTRMNVQILDGCIVKANFITWSSSMVKFMVSEYEVMTFDELNIRLSNGTL